MSEVDVPRSTLPSRSTPALTYVGSSVVELLFLDYLCLS